MSNGKASIDNLEAKGPVEDIGADNSATHEKATKK
jgi:hypothetical protein